ncbi:MBL fold metallo-hydrolase [Sporomusa malonica]|uniref:Phosphoribosyl 1,2-cyclic phosphate phosphodiesterase n=1 Tax=Sporomusa malonica TaxID=112901 RepID=A0A1W1YPX6_9FIRM|nr:MBL fold metallo-hydrolase [Sporomusa malonica]SMC37861.1 phosphoribosyl 1,2-cyclic phosphate phosphodiesterase [Sporomusa malonica]
MERNFILLGTGAGPGLPSFFCDCVACQEARNNPRLSRTRSGAFVGDENKKILIDASPDLRSQLIREKISEIDCMFLTHWHYDHFGGLGEIEYFVKLKRRRPILAYLPPSAVQEFEDAFPNLADVLEVKPWEFERQYHLGGFRLTPLPANHGIETAGFLVESELTRIAYFPDTAGLPEATGRNVYEVDWLICDATFHGENWFPHSHMSIEQAIDLGRSTQAQKTVLTHLAIHYSQPVTESQLTEKVARFGNVIVAYDGMRIKF